MVLKNLFDQWQARVCKREQDHSDALLPHPTTGLQRLSEGEWKRIRESASTPGTCTIRDFTDFDLSGEDFSGLHLEGVRFGSYRLGRGAVLMGTRFNGASLEGAVFCYTDLSNAKFHDSVLTHTDFRGTTCLRSDFRGAQLDTADFYRADLTNSNFTNASLSGVNWYMAHLDNTILDGALLQQPLLWEAHPQIDTYRAWLRLRDNQDIQPSEWKFWRHQLAIYQELYANWSGQGQTRNAAVAYVRLRELGRRAHWLHLVRPADQHGKPEAGVKSSGFQRGWNQVRFYGRHLFHYSKDSLAYHLCGYGENWQRILFWLVFTLLIAGPFSVWFAGGLAWDEEQRIAYWAYDTEIKRMVYLYGQYVLYTVDVMTTANYTGLSPQNDAVRVMSGLYSMLSIFLLGLFGFVIGNRIRHI